MEVRRVDLANCALRTSPKFTTGFLTNSEIRKSQSPFAPIYIYRERGEGEKGGRERESLQLFINSRKPEAISGNITPIDLKTLSDFCYQNWTAHYVHIGPTALRTFVTTIETWCTSHSINIQYCLPGGEGSIWLSEKSITDFTGIRTRDLQSTSQTPWQVLYFHLATALYNIKDARPPWRETTTVIKSNLNSYPDTRTGSRDERRWIPFKVGEWQGCRQITLVASSHGLMKWNWTKWLRRAWRNDGMEFVVGENWRRELGTPAVGGDFDWYD